jgi:hypothetical protein
VPFCTTILQGEEKGELSTQLSSWDNTSPHPCIQFANLHAKASNQKQNKFTKEGSPFSAA